MMNEMPYFRGGKTVRQCRLALVAGALLTFTFATASCSVVEDAVLTTASASPTTIKSRVTPAKAAYGYQKPATQPLRLLQMLRTHRQFRDLPIRALLPISARRADLGKSPAAS